MKVYVVIMRRWGSDETHNYVKGVYSTKADAKFAGEVEVTWRAGKYNYHIDEQVLDAPTPQEEIKHYYDCLPGDVNVE